VIKFKCIYCGQRIAVNDDLACRNGKCPTCKHKLRVPQKPVQAAPLISTDSTKREKKVIEEFYLSDADSSDDMADLVREDAGWLIPVYDEMSLFLISMTLILLYAVNEPFQEQIRKLAAISLHRRYVLHVFVAAAILITGMGLSIYNVFTTREKTDTEKFIMLFYAVLTNAGAGIISGLYVLNSSSIRDWLIIFPIWNIINGVLLIVMLRLKIIDEECITDQKATLVQIFLGLIAVVAILLLCNYVFKLHWAVTLSICIIYTTSLDKGLQSVFPGLMNREDEQSEV
jgi:DNA-directed RNA polymerase subunit RPC12/RpoP